MAGLLTRIYRVSLAVSGDGSLPALKQSRCVCVGERGLERRTHFSLWSDSSSTVLPAGPSVGLALGSLPRASPGAGPELIRGRDSITDRCSSRLRNSSGRNGPLITGSP